MTTRERIMQRVREAAHRYLRDGAPDGIHLVPLDDLNRILAEELPAADVDRERLAMWLERVVEDYKLDSLALREVFSDEGMERFAEAARLLREPAGVNEALASALGKLVHVTSNESEGGPMCHMGTLKGRMSWYSLLQAAKSEARRAIAAAVNATPIAAAESAPREPQDALLVELAARRFDRCVELEQGLAAKEAELARLRSQPRADVEARLNDDGTLDEVVAQNAMVHLEQMGSSEWFLMVGETRLFFTARGKITATLTETGSATVRKHGEPAKGETDDPK